VYVAIRGAIEWLQCHKVKVVRINGNPYEAEYVQALFELVNCHGRDKQDFPMRFRFESTISPPAPGYHNPKDEELKWLAWMCHFYTNTDDNLHGSDDTPGVHRHPGRLSYRDPAYHAALERRRQPLPPTTDRLSALHWLHCPLFEVMYLTLFYTTPDATPTGTTNARSNPVGAPQFTLMPKARFNIRRMYLCYSHTVGRLVSWFDQLVKREEEIEYHNPMYAALLLEAQGTKLYPLGEEPNGRRLLTPEYRGTYALMGKPEQRKWWFACKERYRRQEESLTRGRSILQRFFNSFLSHLEANERTYAPPAASGKPLNDDPMAPLNANRPGIDQAEKDYLSKKNYRMVPKLEWARCGKITEV
jgi:hypothetical protein